MMQRTMFPDVCTASLLAKLSPRVEIKSSIQSCVCLQDVDFQFSGHSPIQYDGRSISTRY